MIIGCGGSGKSTLANKLSTLLNIEAIHLDQYYWNPGWVETKPEEWTKKVRFLVQKEKWVMDGNYGGTMDIRIPKADMIIFLNFPTFTCLRRVLKRTFKHLGKVRPGMPDECKERLDLIFIHYVLMYKRTRSKGLIRKLDGLRSTKNIYILENDKQVSQFLHKIEDDTYGTSTY
jgi:adenylate kinase family enzyme